MALARVMDRPEDFKKLGINPDRLEAWEDGLRDTDEPGHCEIFYFDCSFDDGSTLVLGFRPKSMRMMMAKGFEPNVAINYTAADGTEICDYRVSSVEDTEMMKERCDLRFGVNTLTSPEPWKTYDFHVVPEPDYEVVLEGKRSVQHTTAMDLHFEAKLAPFRPGTGYIAFGPHDELYYNFICITRLEVTGHLSIGGEDKQVTGSAYYNHQWSNCSPAAAFHHWVWGRQVLGRYSILVYDMVAAERFGFEQIPLFTIDDEDGTRILTVTSKDHMKSEILERYLQKETGKRYPRHIRYELEDGDTHATFDIVNTQEIRIIDLYSSAPAPQKAQFDAAHIQPTYTRYLADTKLELTRSGKTETIEGRMLYEFNYTGIDDERAHM